jgi:16S rRNA C967 or C1407 C5-methylase (RsmB/RsmF family)/NOL1/NOP2/fmu family ribosome biogenesis protein
VRAGRRRGVPPLPPGFVEAMAGWLGPAWPDLAEALAQPPVRAARLLRVARSASADPPATDSPPLAVAAPRLPVPEDLARWLGPPVPWAQEAYYVPEEAGLGRHVYHASGAYYLQDPSAMAAATALAPVPGEAVLDLCAAPGGKAAALAWALRGHGLLVANDVDPARVRVLLENLERVGAVALVMQEAPDRLAAAWPGRFDAVLVDAPCSGEALFRRDPRSRREWSPAGVAGAARRARRLLASAVRLVRPGGRLLYATCTFNPVENEQVVAWALEQLPVALAELPDWDGWDPGRPEWAGGRPELARTRRLWPHRAAGEGQFLALFRVHGPGPAAAPPAVAPRSEARGPDRRWLEGLVASVPEAWSATLVHGSEAVVPPPHALPTAGLRVVRPGLAVARRRGSTWEPHQHLAMALAPGAARREWALSLEEARTYLTGAAPGGDLEPGWYRAHVAGLPLGWAKAVPGRVNNRLPASRRRPAGEGRRP